jgi:SHS2 domain-containing protein
MAGGPSPLSPGFELTEHTADVGVHAWGARREDVFVQAARGMLSLVLDRDSVEGRERYVLETEASDEELLLAAWLNELLFAVEGRRIVFTGEFEVSLGAGPDEGGREGAQVALRALAAGEPYEPARHALRSVVKAATLHRLSLREAEGGWEGHVLLDI